MDVEKAVEAAETVDGGNGDDFTFNHPEIKLPQVSGDHEAFGRNGYEGAALCGYCNAGYFTNAFRTETGLTPKAWRRGR